MHAAIEVVHWVLLAAAALLTVPVAVLALQVASAVRHRHPVKEAMSPTPAQSMRSTVTAVLMPAHDEASGIAAAIESVKSQLAAHDRVIVIADNCSDDTARVAEAAGAEVVERTDLTRRGKGYALDHGMKFLAARPPSTVVIVDADCIVAPGAIACLAVSSSLSGRPVQALYLMHSPKGAPLKTRIAEFAWLVKNQVRASGFARLGLPCQLMGSGMAFPWSVISGASLASGQIVEDLQLGLELASAGVPPLFCTQALVTSTFPSAEAGLATQRTRWEHGHLAIIVSMAPRLFARAVVSRNVALLAMALDVCVPPIAALVMSLAVVIVMAALLAIVGGAAISAMVVATLAIAVLAVSLAAAWRSFGRNIITSAELLTLPAYVLAKLPMYMRMVWKRQTEWVRTERDGGGG